MPDGVLIGKNLLNRQMKVLRWAEHRMGDEAPKRKRTPEILVGLQIVEFELLEDLVKWSGEWVQAARKTWDKSANDGDGGYTVDCTDIILVGDLNEVGHNADVGGFGMAIVKQRDNAPEIASVDDPGTLLLNTNVVHVIFDLCCLGDEQGVCGA